MFSPILFLHICSGTLGLLSGGVAIALRKGSNRHRLVGNIFVISMLGLGATGAYLGFMKNEGSNVVAGTTTFYLVATAWLAGRRSNGVSILDRVALGLILGSALVSLAYGFSASNHGASAGPYVFPAFIALLFAAADIRMLARGGFSGKQRLVRHLWRMCFGWFFASGSLFLARPHLFPTVLRQTGVIVLLGFLPLILMIFWLFRVRFSNAYKGKAIPGEADAKSLQTYVSISPSRKTDAGAIGLGRSA